MIAQDIQRDMVEVVCGLEQIGTEHGKCLSCHCYREVVEEMLDTVEIMLGHAELFEEPTPPDLIEARAQVRDLLESSEGKHG